MSIRVGINGFGRIGRLFLRHSLQCPGVEVVAINDLVPADNLAYLFKYDTTHGRYSGDVTAADKEIIIDGRRVAVLAERDPAQLPWQELGVDFVVEATGIFKTEEQLGKHIKAGAKRVILTAPAKDAIPTFVMGVNHRRYLPESDAIISNASCTTNCLAPITQVLLDNFGIEEGLMTTVHSVTASQPSVDGPSHKDWRGGRCASQNIIPSTTGAAQAVALCIPEVQGKLTGMAFRIPTVNVSAVDLTVRVSKKTSYEEICQVMKDASEGDMKGILAYTDEQVVSSDFIGNTHSSIFDKQAGIALNDTFYKLIAWYDNEVGYACRVVDLLMYIASCERGLNLVNDVDEKMMSSQAPQ